MSTTLLPVIAGRATTEGEMKKLEDRQYFEKINEIVDWINKHERQRIERLDIVEDYVNALIQDYKRRHKAKDTEHEKHSQKR